MERLVVLVLLVACTPRDEPVVYEPAAVMTNGTLVDPAGFAVATALPLLRAGGYRVVLTRTSHSLVHRTVAGDVDGTLLTPQGAHADDVDRAPPAPSRSGPPIARSQTRAIPDAGVVEDTTIGASVTAADEAYDHLVSLGPKQEGYLDEPSGMPGALIEPLFLTDPLEATIVHSAAGRTSIAEAVVGAIGMFRRP